MYKLDKFNYIDNYEFEKGDINDKTDDNGLLRIGRFLIRSTNEQRQPKISLYYYEEKISETDGLGNVNKGYNILNNGYGDFYADVVPKYKHIFIQYVLYPENSDDEDAWYICYFIGHGFTKEESIEYLNNFSGDQGITFANLDNIYWESDFENRNYALPGRYERTTDTKSIKNNLTKGIDMTLYKMYPYAFNIQHTWIESKLITYFLYKYAKTNYVIHVETISNEILTDHRKLKPQTIMEISIDIILFNPIDKNKYLNKYDRVPLDKNYVFRDEFYKTWVTDKNFYPTYTLMSLNNLNNKITNESLLVLNNTNYKYIDDLFAYRDKNTLI